MICNAAEHALCDLVSAVSEWDVTGDVYAWLSDPAERDSVRCAVDALLLLDAGHSAGDGARWHLSLLAPQAAEPPPPPWWPSGTGQVCERTCTLPGRKQRIRLRVP